MEDILNYAEDHEHGLCNKRCKTFVQEHTNMSIVNSDSFCCVCQNSSNDEDNRLFECGTCLIKACVLCGYGGGAMTIALSSHSMVKSLLKEWTSEKGGRSIRYIRRSDKRMSTNRKRKTASTVITFTENNSITEGFFDPTFKQWVHMVCGLWTPWARCRNKNTMSSMNVSRVSPPKADVVCSICNRWGGSCIECRIVDCSVKFHPWCAYQKNLLQNELEGVNDEKVGFYGRCVLHGIGPECQSAYDPTDAMDSRKEKEFTCARTEGYQGRRWDCINNNHCSALKPWGGYRAPDEQLNAWIRVNEQKLRSQGIPKSPDSDIERDPQKEYARYKQVKDWKNLGVFKSGIHGLGLYTSQLISRGSMVVEYVGETVGQCVSNKREKEYISGKKLRYKNVCYFFTIDKEHIIDATRKGGIARFINHSCLPNCTSEVITVRHEKKVIFFAERDILAGEEITYDYHFKCEEEEKKIPCSCNSKNCRRSLN